MREGRGNEEQVMEKEGRGEEVTDRRSGNEKGVREGCISGKHHSSARVAGCAGARVARSSLTTNAAFARAHNLYAHFRHSTVQVGGR